MVKPSYKILVIDDEIHLLVGIKGLLARAGHTAITARDSLSGIEMAEKHLPDLILCDIMMPGLDGFKVKEKLNDNPLTKDIPFLYISANASQAGKIKGFEVGADDYITKPFNPDELLARVDAVFRRFDKGRLQASQEVTQQITRMQQEISHNISHELRTPMTQILMSLDIVLREKYEDPETLKWFVDTALSQSFRLNAIIDDFIFLSNYDVGHNTFMRQKIHLDTDFIEPLKQREKLYEDKNMNLQVKIEPGVVIHAPRHEFKLVALHLVDNGLKFAPPATTVDVNISPNGEGGCFFTVTDFGEGIPEDMQEKVFERFFQVSQGDARQHGGLGVGLTIARILARSMGGDVTITSQEKGCRVQMEIPPGACVLPY
ncbi:MAG: hybrid sensor histidine kinase/response regulator [Chloroflexi bacterium]|nr:hybrid sensor histidine kinase/response regulator [Chloroflexota bacterium]